MQNKSRAFTLIELLVVVLIIGILAAVAVPQYEKVVEKSKATQALTLLKSAYQAAATYYMANGTYPNSFDEMGFEIPWTGTTKWANLINEGVALQKETRSNADWSLQLYHTQTGGFSIFMGRISGKYAGAGFAMNVVNSSGELRPGKIRCAERKEGGLSFDTNLSDGDYCVKIMNGTVASDATATAYRSYALP